MDSIIINYVRKHERLLQNRPVIIDTFQSNNKRRTVRHAKRKFILWFGEDHSH